MIVGNMTRYNGEPRVLHHHRVGTKQPHGVTYPLPTITFKKQHLAQPKGGDDGRFECSLFISPRANGWSLKAMISK